MFVLGVEKEATVGSDDTKKKIALNISIQHSGRAFISNLSVLMYAVVE